MTNYAINYYAHSLQITLSRFNGKSDTAELTFVREHGRFGNAAAAH